MSFRKAVALSYPENAAAPIITARAYGDLAERMVEIADENNVPIVQNEMLVNVLSRQKIGTLVPEETWTVLAKIFAFVVQIDEKNKKDIVGKNGSE